jgi:hypothetical protein
MAGGREIEYRQATKTDADAAFDEPACVIRATVRQQVRRAT